MELMNVAGMAIPNHCIRRYAKRRMSFWTMCFTEMEDIERFEYTNFVRRTKLNKISKLAHY